MNPKIFIFGDSWGKGEWCDITHKILHKGIEDYFVGDGYQVKNFSIPGSSLNNSIQIIGDNVNQIDDSDIILFIQTDPFRNFQSDNNKFTEIKTYTSLINLQNEIIETTYQKLNYLNKKIYCLGGCTKLNLEIIKKYKNLNPLTESIIEFLVPELKQPTFWMGDWNYIFAKNLNVDELELFLNDVVNPNTLFNHKNLFYPDGSHPNRIGHKIIYDKICQSLSM